MAASPPPYAPNVVNQTVDYNGITWKGQPGGQWTAQSTSSGAPVSTGDPVQDAENLAAFEQKQQIAANQPAIATLQTQGTTLAQQYQNLLQSVINQGSATYNTATSGENAYLASRGLLSQSGEGNNELSQAQNTVNTTNATNQANVETDAANTQTQIAQAIASLQAGNVGQALTFGQNIANTEAGIENVNTQAQAQLASAKLPQYVQAGGIVFNPVTGLTSTGGGKGGGDSSNVNDSILQAIKILRQTGQSKNKSQASINNYIY